MDEKLQQAMAAARMGQKQEAQFLLTQLLRDHPDDAQAWFLLGHLVESPEKQLTYLRKAVSLDPDHEMAAQRLTQIESSEVAEIPLPPLEMEEPMPEALVPEAAAEVGELAWAEALDALVEEEAAEEVAEALPLEATAAAAIAPEKIVKPAKVKTAAVVRPAPPKPDLRGEQQLLLNRALIALSVAAAVVLVLLIYLIFTSI